ncbi:MAG: MATE family efflux transporter [Planctomycetes bacterium]|nr:MATE family efflux transporter [Planctomycetota bacterium]
MSDKLEKPIIALTSVHPLREVWSIAWPTVMTMTSYTVMQFVDALMVARVSPLAVAAQGNGGIWSFTPIAFAFGLLTVVNTYVSQNLGANTPQNSPKYAWASFWLSLLIWVVVLLPFAFCLPWLFEYLHSGQAIENVDELVHLESGYAKILLIGAVILMTGKGLHHYFFGMHRPKVVTISALAGNIVNIVANYILIFGEDGLPALGLPGIPGVKPMGLFGAAIGTVLGTLVELAIPAAIFLGPKMNAEFKTRQNWKPSWSPIKDLCKLGWPAALQFGNEIICWSIFMTVLVGKFGAEHMTAGWAVLKFMHLSFMPAVGFSVATTSLVGKYIGAGQPDVAASRARWALGIAMVYMTICALIFFFFRADLISWFVGGKNVTPEQAEMIISIGSKLMICAAIFQTVDAFGIVYTGALRGAGDTVWPGVVTVIYSWSFIVLGGLGMTVVWPELESVGPWIAASVYIILYGITMAWRFESGRWRSIKLLGTAREEAAEIAPIGPGIPAGDATAAVRDIAESMVDASQPKSKD